MKIYFAGSIRAGRTDAPIYVRLVEELKSHGEVLTEHVAFTNAEISDESIVDADIHDKNIERLTKCDLVVAEVTQPSLGVGYEIGRAICLGKRIICLHRPKEGRLLSAMIAGAKGEGRVQVVSYSEVNEAIKLLREELSALKKKQCGDIGAVSIDGSGDNGISETEGAVAVKNGSSATEAVGEHQEGGIMEEAAA